MEKCNDSLAELETAFGDMTMALKGILARVVRDSFDQDLADHLIEKVQGIIDATNDEIDRTTTEVDELEDETNALAPKQE